MKRTLYLSLLIAACSAIALAAPASSLAASCPAGQKGTPPYCEKEATPPPKPTPTPTPPPPPLTTTATANEVASGAVKVTFSVPGAGTLTLKGKAIKVKKLTVDAAGNVTLTLKPTGKVLQQLENKGWTRRKRITVTFTAADGSTQTIKVVVRFRKP
jgi:VCBS repeat-containing protein